MTLQYSINDKRFSVTIHCNSFYISSATDSDIFALVYNIWGLHDRELSLSVKSVATRGHMSPTAISP